MEKLNLPVEYMKENENQDNSVDLIIIAGPLEHCYDPNKVMSLCAKAKKNSIIILEARGEPRSVSSLFNVIIIDIFL